MALSRLLIFIWAGIASTNLSAQGSFAPQVGEEGSTAISKDDNQFRDWATSCVVERGLRQIDIPDSGYASSGSQVYVLGSPDAPLTVSLGDGGTAIAQFSAPFYDGEGYDFAVFENGFGSGDDAFLELAFVEVSSDGINFFRFPAISEVLANVQKQSFENSDATYYHNLAGKYTVNFGVPFDLADIPDTSLLDKQHITHVRVIDVVGTIDSAFASFDAQGSIINDPWPTNFPQGGFDLDAIGIIHSNIPLRLEELHEARMPNSNKQGFDILGRAMPSPASKQPAVLIGEDGIKRIQLN